MKLSLIILPEELAIVQLAAKESIPSWVAGSFYSITRTDDELSIVCSQGSVPQNIKADRNWRALKVMGPLDFSLVGVLSNLSTALTKGGVSIFAVSTYNTDYLLIKKENLEKTINILKSVGHKVGK